MTSKAKTREHPQGELDQIIPGHILPLTGPANVEARPSGSTTCSACTKSRMLP